jgi:hypothetical protein
MNSRKGQAAFEYMVTYGWAILAAIIAIGALSYFGFVSPSNLLPDKCNFGRQLECLEYKITDAGDVSLILRNNFGKQINITDINMVEDDNGVTGNHPLDDQVTILSGAKNETSFSIDSDYWKSAGEKQSLNLRITFKRSDFPDSPEHNITGTVFVTVSED